jgi:hypothetical protein
MDPALGRTRAPAPQKSRPSPTSRSGDFGTIAGERRTGMPWPDLVPGSRHQFTICDTRHRSALWRAILPARERSRRVQRAPLPRVPLRVLSLPERAAARVHAETACAAGQVRSAAVGGHAAAPGATRQPGGSRRPRAPTSQFLIRHPPTVAAHFVTSPHSKFNSRAARDLRRASRRNRARPCQAKRARDTELQRRNDSTVCTKLASSWKRNA